MDFPQSLLQPAPAPLWFRMEPGSAGSTGWWFLCCSTAFASRQTCPLFLFLSSLRSSGKGPQFLFQTPGPRKKGSSSELFFAETHGQGHGNPYFRHHSDIRWSGKVIPVHFSILHVFSSLGSFIIVKTFPSLLSTSFCRVEVN